jgi:hypothetical protein
MGKPRLDDSVRAYEPYEERVRPVVLFTVWLAIGTLVVLGLMKLAHDAFDRGTRQEGSRPLHPLAADREEPPEPRLQANPAVDLHSLQEREEARLTTYGWIDRPGGVVHIPIERAMEL